MQDVGKTKRSPFWWVKSSQILPFGCYPKHWDFTGTQIGIYLEIFG
jgi:hypothetical protein